MSDAMKDTGSDGVADRSVAVTVGAQLTTQPDGAQAGVVGRHGEECHSGGMPARQRMNRSTSVLWKTPTAMVLTPRGQNHRLWPEASPNNRRF